MIYYKVFEGLGINLLGLPLFPDYLSDSGDYGQKYVCQTLNQNLL